MLQHTQCIYSGIYEYPYLELDGNGFFTPFSWYEPSYMWLMTLFPSSHINYKTQNDINGLHLQTL